MLITSYNINSFIVYGRSKGDKIMIDKYYSVDYLHRLYNMYDDKCVKEYIDQRIECIYNITNNDVFLKSNYIDDEHVDLNKLNNDDRTFVSEIIQRVWGIYC